MIIRFYWGMNQLSINFRFPRISFFQLGKLYPLFLNKQIIMEQLQRYQQARLARDRRFDGEFFVAVKTTGIFCRPICPANLPQEKNVEYYPLAQQAMEAGYRPCLRCRPDSAPQSWAWKGVDTTVERAVRLIKQSPQVQLSELVERLGISDRYLRDLFKQKLGIGPKKFQLYERLLFAKQLLHQSGLSVEQVAQASGFSSARRLQENMKASLGLTPARIRSQKREQNGVLQLQLAYRPPYNWAHVRDFLCVRAIAEIEKITETSYSRTFIIDGVTGWFRAEHNPRKCVFDVSLKLSDASQLKRVISEIRRVLDLDAEPVVINQSLMSAGLEQSSIVEGIRIPGVWSSFEAGCRAILGQQISVKAAINLLNTLAVELGEHSCFGFHFPLPEAIAESDLAFLGMPARRKDTLRNFAHACSSSCNEELDGWLDIKGVGPWTVAYAKMRGQSNPDIWLNSDLVIKKQIAQHELTADNAAPWRSYLTFQLWSMA